MSLDTLAQPVAPKKSRAKTIAVSIWDCIAEHGLTGKVTVRGAAYYYRHTRRHKKVSLGKTIRQINQRLSRLVAMGPLSGELLAGPTKKVKLFAAIRVRAKKSEWRCMSREEFDRLWERAKGRCELTGITFSTDRHPCGKRPWAPSVDRSDNSLGYEFDNCRLVCTAVNFALNEFGDAVLIKIAKAICSRVSS